MYVPSEPEDERARGGQDAPTWYGAAPAPIRWAGPNGPSGLGPTLYSQGPQSPTPPEWVPVRRSPKAPTRSGALLSIGSFIVSVALYAFFFGLPLGLGITVLLLIHELGHYVVIRAKGLPASLPVFIPLIGAYVAMRRLPASVRDDAVIALAGPLAGGYSALACVALYQTTGMILFLQLAFLGYVLNLLNLVPILPLDGGRIANAITPWLGPVAFALIVWYALSVNNILLLILIVIFGLPALVRSLAVGRRSPFFRVSLFARAFLALAYLLVTATLFFGLLATPVRLVFQL